MSAYRLKHKCDTRIFAADMSNLLKFTLTTLLTLVSLTGYSQFIHPKENEVEQLFICLKKNNIKEMVEIMQYDSTVYFDDTSKKFTQITTETKTVIDAEANIMKIIYLSAKPDYNPDCKDCKYDFDKLYRFDEKGRLVMEYGAVFREGYFSCKVFDSAGNIAETYYSSSFMSEEEFYALPANNPGLWPASHQSRFYYNDSGTLTKEINYRYQAGKWVPLFTYYFKGNNGVRDSLKTNIYEEYRKKGQIDETTIIAYDSNKQLAYYKYELHSLHKGGISRTIREWVYTRGKNKEVIQFEEWDIFDIEKKRGPSVKETTINFYDDNQLPERRMYLRIDYNGNPYTLEKAVEFIYSK